MATDIHNRASAPAFGPIPLSKRLAGYGSVFGKTIRDSRRATIAVGVGLGLVLIGVSAAIASQFATPASRQEIGAVVAAVPPILAGLAGKPVNVETLGATSNTSTGPSSRLWSASGRSSPYRARWPPRPAAVASNSSRPIP